MISREEKLYACGTAAAVWSNSRLWCGEVAGCGVEQQQQPSGVEQQQCNK